MFIRAHEAEYMFVATLSGKRLPLLASGWCPYKLFSETKKAEKLAQKLNAENTFEAIAREWHQAKADRWSLRYRDEIIDTFEKDIFPYIGNRVVQLP